MDQSPEELKRLLEQATAAEEPAEKLPPEAASLRQTWLAWGRLLESAAAQAPAARPLELPKRRPAAIGALAVALAASLLVGLAVYWQLRGASPTAGNSQVEAIAAQEVPQGVSPSVAEVASRPPRATVSPPDAAPASEGPSWDDATDQQLAAVDYQLARLKVRGFASGDDAILVEHGLREIAQELEQSPL